MKAINCGGLSGNINNRPKDLLVDAEKPRMNAESVFTDRSGLRSRQIFDSTPTVDYSPLYWQSLIINFILLSSFL